MTPTTSSPTDFYVTGGSLKAGDPSYVVREADDELLDHCIKGDFCYILTPRQLGKSSLIVSTAARLKEKGIRTAIVDLTDIGGVKEAVTADQWYYGVAYRILRELGITFNLKSWWQENDNLPPLQRLTEYFRDVLLAHCPERVVIFVDEIDTTINLPFSDDFFAVIRACYNARAKDDAIERLSFVLAGVATPSQLINDPKRTPFNVGERIELSDFTRDQASKLAAGLHPDRSRREALLERILYWTNGHPYLTQSLCTAVIEAGPSDESPEEMIDGLVRRNYFTEGSTQKDHSLRFVRDRLTGEGPHLRPVLKTYRRVLKGDRVEDQPTSPVQATLKLSGAVLAESSGELRIRNRVYETVFDSAWAKAQMPRDRTRQVAYLASAAAVILAAVVGWLLWAQAQRDAAVIRLTEAKASVWQQQEIGYSVSWAELDSASLETHIEDLRLLSTTDLDLSFTQVSDLSVLEKLPSLQYLDLSGTPVSDLSVLEKLTSLQSLSLSGTQVSDLSGLEKLPSLQYLDLSGTPVSDLSVLEKLTSLQVLELSGTPVSDLSVLEKLTSLQVLDLSGTPVSAEEIDALRRALPRTSVLATARKSDSP